MDIAVLSEADGLARAGRNGQYAFDIFYIALYRHDCLEVAIPSADPEAGGELEPLPSAQEKRSVEISTQLKVLMIVPWS